MDVHERTEDGMTTHGINEADDRVEQEQTWIFTWGYGHEFPNRYRKIKGTRASSREKMFAAFGEKWSFQYTAEEEPMLLSHRIFEVDPKVYERLK